MNCNPSKNTHALSAKLKTVTLNTTNMEALAGLLALIFVCLFFSYCQKLEDNKKLPSKPPVVQPNS